MLYVFTSAWAPFEPLQAYTKFAALALLEHGGDLRAAKALAEDGYGTPYQTSWVETARLSPALTAEVAPEVREGLKGLIYTASELAALNLPRPEFLVDDLIMKGGVTMAVGWGKMGKSTLFHQLAVVKSNGGRFLGRDLPAGPMLYVNWEDALFLTKERLFTQTGGQVPCDNYHVMKSRTAIP